MRWHAETCLPMRAVAKTPCAWIRPTAQGIVATAPSGTKGILTSLEDAQMSMNASAVQAPALTLHLAKTQLEVTNVHVLLAAIFQRKQTLMPTGL